MNGLDATRLVGNTTSFDKIPSPDILALVGGPRFPDKTSSLIPVKPKLPIPPRT